MEFKIILMKPTAVLLSSEHESPSHKQIILADQLCVVEGQNKMQLQLFYCCKYK